MDKQRLLELAGITEARYAGDSDEIYAVAIDSDSGEGPEIYGPFMSKEEAERYIQWEKEQYDIDEEWDELGKVVRVYKPEW